MGDDLDFRAAVCVGQGMVMKALPGVNSNSIEQGSVTMTSRTRQHGRGGAHRRQRDLMEQKKRTYRDVVKINGSVEIRRGGDDQSVKRR